MKQIKTFKTGLITTEGINELEKQVNQYIQERQCKWNATYKTYEREDIENGKIIVDKIIPLLCDKVFMIVLEYNVLNESCAQL